MIVPNTHMYADNPGFSYPDYEPCEVESRLDYLLLLEKLQRLKTGTSAAQRKSTRNPSPHRD